MSDGGKLSFWSFVWCAIATVILCALKVIVPFPDLDWFWACIPLIVWGCCMSTGFAIAMAIWS